MPLLAFAQETGTISGSDPAEDWVDSVMQTLDNRERVAQLINVAAYSNRGAIFQDSISDLITRYKIGGLIFFQGGPVRQAILTNRYQSESDVPLLISIDAEWGLGMRLDSTISFPYNMALGAIQNDSLIYRLGGEIGRQLKRIGVHLNFAPVVDVNNNPKNPVINYRSFGEQPDAVARKGLLMINGMQEQGIIATAKHFPGHGDTDTDSHYDLPQLLHSRQRLDQVELKPFKAAIDNGVGGIMVAHMNIPVLDSTENLPSTLSKPIVSGLLKDKLGFQGLIMTDALNMKGVTKYYDPGEVDVEALIAGNDLLMYSEDVGAVLNQVETAIRENRISQQAIDNKCRKLLRAKYSLGLHRPQKIETQGLLEDLNTAEADLLNRQLVESSMTMVKNNGIVPLKRLDTLSIASVSIGADHITPFQRTLEKYTGVNHFIIPKGATPEQTVQFRSQLKEFDLLIVGLHGVLRRPGNQKGYSDATYQLLDELVEDYKTILVSFRNAYTLDLLPIDKAPAVLCAYQDQILGQQVAAQILFGAVGANGKLPVTVNALLPVGTGFDTPGGLRLKYTQPEEVGIESRLLTHKIDSIVQVGLDSAAYPGAQVLVAKDGKVVFHKTYGYLTYDSLKTVSTDDIYDLASVTKITGPLPALMKLYGQGKLDLDAPFSTYWPDFKGTDKADMTVREVLAHYARLKPYIVYWEQTKKKSGRFKKKFFRDHPSRKFSVAVTEDLYLRHNYRQKGIYKAIRKSKLEEEKKYLYSGLSFYLYPEIIENLTGVEYQHYVNQQFYQPLGAKTLTYRPLKLFPANRIVPTEYDDFFRMKQLHGTVHDEGAAMMDGISGNAGLFSTANDLAKLIQMYLWWGEYGGERYIDEDAVKEFTRCQYCEEGNRRGLGFDKPLIENKENGSTAKDASDATFGHSGYTGTYTMADPENGLLMVFMSNRVYPTRNNPKLYQLNIRPAIHQSLYDALGSFEF
ncbi:MAG: beta-N-acetylglucosaminidase [Cyclobacteriaceae bacterium]|nr:MAG: beta-N-acetylglucosaminidase [Cyclobacteriaceae bacterium]